KGRIDMSTVTHATVDADTIDATVHSPAHAASTMSLGVLSDLQRNFLVWLYQQYQRGDVDGGWGVPYTGVPKGLTRSQQASISRAVRRLEQRGFVERTNQVSGPAPNEWIRKHRTTHVRFLPPGTVLVERLTQANIPSDNHVA